MNKNKFLSLLTNFGYVISSNLLTLIVSSLVILVLPKVIGVSEYGYWQLYTFYLTYIGFFHFGWADGIYLKFGGQNYNQLDKEYFSSQISSFIIFQILISLVSIFGSYIFTDGDDTLFIFLSLSINFFITNTRLLFIYILQTTNRIREASQIIILDRLIYVLLLLLILLLGKASFRNMIIVDNIGRVISLLYALYFCRDLTFSKTRKNWIVFKDSFENIAVGINLMLANIASSLIIGVVRFAIQKTWDIATFGKVSLTLSLSNLVMTFINAVGVVIFPLLKRAPQDKLDDIYKSLRMLLMISMFGALLLYFPLRLILINWLPAYKQSLEFMGIVFPIIIFESKTSMLLNTYLKALRKEKTIFSVNILTTILSIVISLITVSMLHSLTLAVLAIVVLLAFRSTLLEIEISKLLKLSIGKEVFSEFLMVAVFISGNLILGIRASFVTYLLALSVYTVIFFDKRKLANLKGNI